VELVDGADGGARDSDLLAVEEKAGVVEVGAALVAAAVVALAGGVRGDQRRGGGEPEDDCQDPSHGPGAVQFGLQSEALRPLAGQAGWTNGFEASGAGAEAEPGQRPLSAGVATEG